MSKRPESNLNVLILVDNMIKMIERQKETNLGK